MLGHITEVMGGQTRNSVPLHMLVLTEIRSVQTYHRHGEREEEEEEEEEKEEKEREIYQLFLRHSDIGYLPP